MKLTDVEIELYYTVAGRGGSFNIKLFELICASDSYNQAKLAIAFPEFVSVVQRYQNEAGYWERIEKEMQK